MLSYSYILYTNCNLKKIISKITWCKKSLKVETHSSIEWYFDWQPASHVKHRHGARCPDVADITSFALLFVGKFAHDALRWIEARPRYKDVITSEHNNWLRWNYERSWNANVFLSVWSSFVWSWNRFQTNWTITGTTNCQLGKQFDWVSHETKPVLGTVGSVN